MSGFLVPQLLFQGWSPNGGFLSAGILTTYQAGTNIPATVYQDYALTAPWPNPLTLNSLGQALIYLTPGQSYKFSLTDSVGNLIPGYPVDNISSGGQFQTLQVSGNIDIGPNSVPVYNLLGNTVGYFPQSAQELAAGVVPVNYSYGTAPHDIRRYAGWTGNGSADDSGAWAALALVMGQGGSGFVPAGPSYVASQVTFFCPLNANVSIFAYGVQLYTNNGAVSNAIDGLQFAGGGNLSSLTVYGITYFQLDAIATSGFNIYSSNLTINSGSNITLIDCQVDINSVTAASTTFACFKVIVSASSPTYGFWNKFIRCGTRQSSGNAPTYAPSGVLLSGQANATIIRDCKFSSVNYAVTIQADSNGVLANAVLIDGNAFEGGITGVLVNGLSISSSQIGGLRITNNRAESLTGSFLTFQNLKSDSVNWPTWLAGNYFVSSTVAYVTNAGNTPSSITYCSLDMGLVPNYGNSQTLSSTQPLLLKTIQTTGAIDVLQATVQQTGGGISLFNSTGNLMAGLYYNSGTTTGEFHVGLNKVIGARIAGYGTPTGGSHQASFAAGSITLANLAAAVAQLIIDLESHGLIGT